VIEKGTRDEKKLKTNEKCKRKVRRGILPAGVFGSARERHSSRETPASRTGRREAKGGTGRVGKTRYVDYCRKIERGPADSGSGG